MSPNLTTSYERRVFVSKYKFLFPTWSLFECVRVGKGGGARAEYGRDLCSAVIWNQPEKKPTLRNQQSPRYLQKLLGMFNDGWASWWYQACHPDSVSAVLSSSGLSEVVISFRKIGNFFARSESLKQEKPQSILCEHAPPNFFEVGSKLN